MSQGAQEAEFVIRLALQGMSGFIRVTGEAGTHIAAMIQAAMNQPDNSPGVKRLKDLLKSGEELKVFTLPEDRVKDFATEAKRYGIQYCFAKRTEDDKAQGVFDVLVKYRDAPRLNRIAERLQLGQVEGGIETVVPEAEQQKAVELTEAQKLMQDMFSPNEKERQEEAELKKYQEPEMWSPSESSLTPSNNERPSVRESLKQTQVEIDSSRDMFAQARNLRQQMFGQTGWDAPEEEYNERGERLFRGKIAEEMTPLDQVQQLVDMEMAQNGHLNEDFIRQMYMSGYEVDAKGIVKTMDITIPTKERQMIADMMRNPGEQAKTYQMIKEMMQNE